MKLITGTGGYAPDLSIFQGMTADEMADGIERELCARNFIEFVKLAWKVIEPANPYVHNWHADAIAEHLEAVTRGEITRLLLNVPPGSSKPVWEEELVLTEDGYKKLKSIKVGDYVYTRTGRLKPVVAVHEQGILPLYNVKTIENLLCAGDHSILIRTRGCDEWIEVKNLKKGDILVRTNWFEGKVIFYETPLVGVELSGEGLCRCLSIGVDETEDNWRDDMSFIASGVVVHNSTLCSVLWPAWEWTLAPHLRFLTIAHSEDLAIRDTVKMRRLVQSEWYQNLWGDKVILRRDQNEKGHFENEATGFRQASPSKSLTGKRGDRVILDDPNSVSGAASKADREAVNTTFSESVPTRLNSPIDSAIVVVMQRLHEGDVSGHILSGDYGYEHVMIPMRFERDRKCYTSIGWEDPRTEEGELMFPERFPEWVVDRDEKMLGNEYAIAGQMQQRPVPRGGGILKREWWGLWDDEVAGEYGATKGTYPKFDFILASLDGAYTAKAENDPSALTIWGMFTDRGGNPKIMLAYAWAERLEFPDLMVKVRTDCLRFEVDCLIIEAKATGHSIAQEIKRTLGRGEMAVRLIDPRNAQTGTGSKDKVMRAHAVTAVFEDGMVFAPDKKWAEKVIMECETFPKGKHDDLVDSTVQALEYFRTMGFALKRAEVSDIDDEEMQGTYDRRLEGSGGSLYDC